MYDHMQKAACYSQAAFFYSLSINRLKLEVDKLVIAGVAKQEDV